MVNLDWNSLFPESKVSHLTTNHSDHRPIWLELKAPPSRAIRANSTDWNMNNFENFHRHIRKLQEGIEEVYMTAVGQPDMTRL
ncbi:uncharacterized protein G2W53_041930 [Senna tora]|uniref:Uncharacterized protein n=1 Tax=Senna tora TaxID=362788 RepID=A0A834W3B7_9FABA|nr:uncharacterized protein G2W53_041930 [Senna tora]